MADLLELTAGVAEASAPKAMTIQFLRNLTGADPARDLTSKDPLELAKEVVVFSRGQTVELPNDEATHWMWQGLAQPICDAAKAWCKQKKLTDAELLKRFKATCLLMDKGEIHTAEPASVSEPA